MGAYTSITVQGDHYSMGLQHGLQTRKLRAQIAAAMEARFSEMEHEGTDTVFEALLEETHELLQEIDGPLLAMIRGQAEALALQFDRLLRYDLVTYLRDDLVCAGSRAARIARPGLQRGQLQPVDNPF